MRIPTAAVLPAAALSAVLCGAPAGSGVPADHGVRPVPDAPAVRAAPAAGCTGSVPFASGEDGYAVFRIPALAWTRGVLVAFAEGRRDGPADDGDIDVVARRSLDGGCSWGPLRVVADDGPDTVGNPAPVVDRGTGRVVLLTTRQHGGRAGARDRRVWLQSSPDGGASWTEPVEITADVKRPGWRWYATGPGHGVELRSGRMAVAADHTDGGSLHGAHLLLSDDGGRHWRIGAVDDHDDGELNPDETAVAELPDGSLYLNTRDQYGRTPATRAFTRSEDGGESFTAPFRPLPGLAAPVVQGSLLQVRGAPCLPLLLAAPDDPARRRGMAVRRSTDGGLGWNTEARLTDGPAAYSDLAEVAPGVVGVLYETGGGGPYERIAFRLVPVGCGAGW
ncbi:glycoside hydrolase [Streptacidiphilus sp. ASG 303]|uniref:sialidase family protein n=1 Tax=Streptacidiphilus sp. ASG 303 TaxID=2896847 RepID=UPI001E5FD819|nr:sialidase family protein [Streptacidiphilus sp. ASG 303]MCD0482576.1 glycoside hydrolase [Streptacidiphilus sp. ASG 303]